jgi:hypothetical protein
MTTAHPVKKSPPWGPNPEIKPNSPHPPMKIPRFLVAVATMASTPLVAQTLIDSDSFFDPDFNIRRNGASSGLLNLTVNNSAVSGSGSNTNNTWIHSAGGHAQVRTSIEVVVPLAHLDAQLAAYTRTSGDSLIFGRQITTEAEILGIVDVGPTLEGMINQVAGASVIYNWQSTSTISGLAIVPNQLYRVDFTVASGAGLPVDLLDSSTFGITNSSVSGAMDESATLLNLLDILSIGNSASTGNFSFVFKSNQNLSSLDFAFEASTGVGVSLLGGTSANQNVLSFSGFQVTAIPEPGSLTLCGAFATMLAFRRRRQS